MSSRSSSSSSSSSNSSLPSVIVLDLDGCVWYPEMYELWGGGGAPFTKTHDGNLMDKAGQRVYLMGDVRDILSELATHDRWKNTKIAIASRCDEPSWARECLEKFSLVEGMSLGYVFNGPDEIYKGNKANHLKTIAQKTGRLLNEMVFFDDQYGNCKDVASIGVTAVYTPEGLTMDIFKEALSRYPSPGKVLGSTPKGSHYW